ncbi:MAG: MFS transporter [Spirochaetaceae bacterium]|nr:MFS transporter [Spirochaetaceae bacterium]
METETSKSKNRNKISAIPGGKPSLARKIVGIFGVYRGLPRPLYTLFVASVVNSIGTFVFPFMTLYLTGKLGMSQGDTGKFMMLLSIIYIPGNFIGGKLSDRFGRKRVMIIAQVVSAVLYIPCGFTVFSRFVPWLILVSVFFDGITDPARSAMMTDLTTPENRRTAFSLTYLGHNLGFAVGSLIAGFLFESAASWLFWGNAAGVLAATVIVGLKVPETKPTQKQIDDTIGSGSTEEAHKGNLLQALGSRPFLILYTLLTACYGFVYTQHRFALPLQTKATFGASGSAIFGSLMTLNAVLVIIFSTSVMSLTKKWKPINAVALSGLFFAVGFGMIGFAHNVWMIYLSTVIWTFGEIINATNDGAYVANHTPISHRGRFHAVLPLIGGIGGTISPAVMGKVIDDHSLAVVWPLIGAIAAIASLLIWILGRVEDSAAGKKKAAVLAPSPVPGETPGQGA